MYKCNYCPLTSKKKWNIQVHEARKHTAHSSASKRRGVMYGTGVQAATYNQHVSNPHPYVHPYLNNANQQPDARPQRTPEMVANNTYYAEETRAPTKISVGPNGPRAPTTISVPPQIGGVQNGSGIGGQFYRP